MGTIDRFFPFENACTIENKMGKPFNLLSLLVLSTASCFVAQMRPTPQEKEITFKISVPLEFKGRAVSGSLGQSEVSGLLNLPVRNGNTDINEGYGVEMTSTDGKKFMVYTCREWKKAQAEQSYSATTYDMAMEGFLIRTCGLLVELEKAKLPRKSFIANPRVSLANLNLLPAEILGAVTEDEARGVKRLRGKTVSEVVPSKDIERVDSDVITLSYGGVRQSFWEGARADFNGDGIEDILVFTGGRAEGGTMGYADYFALTRMSPSGPLKLIQRTELQQKKNQSDLPDAQIGEVESAKGL